MHHICIYKLTREKRTVCTRPFTYRCRAQTYLLLYVSVETASIVMGSSKKKKKRIRKLRLESRTLVNWDIIKDRDIALKIVKSDNSLLFNLRIRFMRNFRLFLFKS